MMHFRKIGDIDVSPVLDRVHELRLDEPRDDDLTVQGLLHKAVPLRLHDNPTHASFFEDLPVHDLPLLTGWPEMQNLIYEARSLIREDQIIGQLVDADSLGRVVFSIIEADGFIQWHRDTGDYINATLRFHTPLITTPDAINYAPDDERLHIKVGELTWLDNRCMHSAVNWNAAARNHLLFELRCRN